MSSETVRDVPIDEGGGAPFMLVQRSPGRAVFTDDEVERALEALESSNALRHSAQLRRLLRYLVVNAQAGAESSLREIAVGIGALGRDPRTFDPKRDPIVRTEARRLRAKLARHYAGEGRDAELVIELPKGGYLPLLRRTLGPDTVDEASIAVLPFANFTGDPAREPFCDALCDEVIDALARIEALKVVARTSAFRFKGQQRDVREVASALSVRMVLEGSVQRAGAHVRVLAQLVLGTDGRHVWSQAFEAPMTDATAIPVELADDIVRALERAGALAATSQSHARPPRGTRDADARDRYDRALAILRTLDVERFDRARDLLREALDRDPGFARAHHLLALELTNRVAMCAQPAGEAMPEALAHLRAALAIDPDFAQARALLAWITGVWERNWERSLAELRRAVRDAPGNFAVRNTAGNVLALHGRFDEAERELALARELDPLHQSARYNAALAACYARRFDVAIERCDAILDVEPAHPALGLRITAQIAGGLKIEALSGARALAAAQPDSAIAAARLAEALAANGDVAQGLLVLERAAGALAQAGATHWALAHFHAVCGDVDVTWRELEAACTGRESNTESVGVDPYFASLHDDARWPAFLKRHGMPEVASETRTRFRTAKAKSLR